LQQIFFGKIAKNNSFKFGSFGCVDGAQLRQNVCFLKSFAEFISLRAFQGKTKDFCFFRIYCDVANRLLQIFPGAEQKPQRIWLVLFAANNILRVNLVNEIRDLTRNSKRTLALLLR
jgi:hypothetical protein